MKRDLPLRIAALLAACVLLTAADGEPAANAPSVLVTATRLQTGSLPETVTAYGSVEPASEARETVMAPLAARVDEIYVRRGEDVAKGTKLIRLVPSPTVATSYAQAQSALSVARQLVARTRKMVNQHLATQQQLADAEKSESDARALLSALQAQGAGGPSVVRAPFNAVVTAISTSRGAIVSEGTALFELAQPEGLVLKVGVVPVRAAGIKAGQSVTITPIGATVSVAGTVILTASIVDPTSGLVPIEIALPMNGFRPGEMAEAAIATGRINGFVVPHRAILVNENGKPYVVQAVEQRAKLIPVNVLVADGERDVIAGPLDKAAPLILDGNHQLEDGMKVRFAPSDAKAAK